MRQEMHLDPHSLYPNFHAETTRHLSATASTSPRPSRRRQAAPSPKPTSFTTATNNNSHYGNNNHTASTSSFSPHPLPIRRSTATAKNRLASSRSHEVMPHLAGMSVVNGGGSRPTTPVATGTTGLPLAASLLPTAAMPNQRATPLVRELSFQAKTPQKHHHHYQKGGDPPEDALDDAAQGQGHQPPRRQRTRGGGGGAGSRSVVMRGDLAIDGAPPQQQHHPWTSHPSSHDPRIQKTRGLQPPVVVVALQDQDQATAATAPLHDVVVSCIARPRSRYARREGVATPITPLHQHMQPQSQPRRLSLSASASVFATDLAITNGGTLRPASTSSASALSGNNSNIKNNTRQSLLRGSQSTGSFHAPASDGSRTQAATAITRAPPLLSWTEQDTSSFFLTEIDAKEAADQWQIAKSIAHGSHFLYALREYERAVACFGDALSTVQQLQDQPQDPRHHAAKTAPRPEYLSLVAFLHHHMGIAFQEDGQAKWALMMQKKALELAQKSGDLRIQGRALKALGVLFLDRKDPTQALDCQEQALQLARETSDVELEARVYANLGNLASTQQQLVHAISCHQRDLLASSGSQLDSAVGQARAHRNLSLVYAQMAREGESDGGGGWLEKQLDQELQAARLHGANAFETDMRRHASDSVGNIYLQLTAPDRKIAEMVASSLTDLLTAKDEEDQEQPEKTEQTPRPI